MRVLVVGCGYVGMALGEVLVRQGLEVFGIRRSLEGTDVFEQLGIRCLAADVTSPETLARLPRSWDWVINTVSAGFQQFYRSVYVEGMRNLIEWLRFAPPQRFVYTSSTGVYGQTDGSSVTEESATEVATDTGRALVDAEQVLLQGAKDGQLPAVVLRVAGIYGPGRGYWLGQFLSGQAVIEGEGQRVLNMIHRDDVVGSIVAALARGRPGQIYNAVDNKPVTQLELFRWLSRTVGREMPPSVAATKRTDSKRTWTSKRVLNHKLRAELDYQFRYPTFREGIAAELQLQHRNLPERK